MSPSPLRSPDFLRLFLSQLASVVGDGAYYIALVWFVKVQTGSDAAVALIALCGAVPAVVGGVFAGVLADQLDRRRLMIGADLGRAALLAVPVALLLGGRLEVWHLALTTVLLSSLSTLFGPAYAASIPQVLPAAALPAANALTQTSFALGALLGPALGGLLVALFSPALGFGLNLGSFLVSALLLWVSRIPSPPPASGQPPRWAQEVLGGWHFFRSAPMLLGMTLMVVGMNVFRTPAQVLLPGLARDELGVGAASFGLLEAMLPAGFVVGGLLMARLHWPAPGRALAGLIVGWGLLLSALGVTPTLGWTAAALLGGGVCLSLSNILGFTVFQTRIPPEWQGRVYGTFNALTASLQPLSVALVVPLSGLLGVRGMFLAAGVMIVLVGLLGRAVPGLWELRGLVPATEAQPDGR